MFGIRPVVPEVTVETLFELLEKGGKITILDVRTEGEVARGKIRNSLNVPLDRIHNIENIIPDKSTQMYVYCLSGSRSTLAVNTLIKEGYKNVFDVKGGLLTWRAKKYPIVTK
ncbi:MAG: rhodanese-like domain-containing protein [Saprospiraceae bacterium]|nr:rhodanese-like domain-containing protein [Saprospiraceae bacterium]